MDSFHREIMNTNEHFSERESERERGGGWFLRRNRIESTANLIIRPFDDACLWLVYLCVFVLQRRTSCGRQGCFKVQRLVAAFGVQAEDVGRCW